MNNKYITALFCTMVLTFFPACIKGQKKASSKEEINTMLELENEVFEMEEETDEQKSIVKF